MFIRARFNRHNTKSKRAEIELTFVLAEGEKLGDALDKTAELAKTKCLDLVLGKAK